MKMTLRQLTLFECVARHMSYTRAAEEKHLTQPAVSIQIKQLEEHVGIQLFEYIGKKLYLTDAGRELQQACTDIFSRLDSLEMALTQMKGGMHGSLRIATVTSANYFAPHLIGEFNRHYPDIEMSLVATNRDSVIQRLLSNKDDLVLMAQVPKDMKLKVYPILDNPMFPVVPAGHPLAGQKKIPISALTQERFLTRELGSGSRKAIDDHLRDAGISLPQTMELGSIETIKQGVMAGLGISILSRFSMALELATGCLVSLDMDTFPIVRTWCLVHPLDKRLSPAAQAFIDYILEHDEQVKQLINNRFLGAELPRY